MSDLYNEKDPVTVLDDSSFIGSNCRIKKNIFDNHGFLKAYAPWCGHCKSKVKCIKKLSRILKEYGVTAYVINADNNPIFKEHFGDKIKGFPTFLRVDDSGNIGEVMTTKDGEQVHTIPGIISSLCANDTRICQYAEIMEDCN